MTLTKYQSYESASIMTSNIDQLSRIGEAITIDEYGTKGIVIGYEFTDRPSPGFPFVSYAVDLEKKEFYHPDYGQWLALPDGVKISEKYRPLNNN